MKKQIIYSLLALTTVCLGACNNNDEIDTANSIFSTEPLERNAFDYWLPTTTPIRITSTSCTA